MDNFTISKFNSFSISAIRAAATVFIFSCHVLQENPINIIKNMGQVFNVGIVIFFFISGYLYGRKKIINIKKWFVNRYLKISIPIIFFILVLSSITLKLNIKTLICYILNLEGFFEKYAIQGTEHLWFISVLMICYMITPLLQGLREQYKINMQTVFIFILIQLLIAIFGGKLFSIYMVYVFCYILTYFNGFMYKGEVSNRIFFFSWVLSIFVLTLRFVIKILDDKYNNIIINKIYECIVVPYTHSIFGFCIILIIIYLASRIYKLKKIKALIKLVDKYSFEIYIVHYMFIIGPFEIMAVTTNYMLNLLFAITVTIITAVLLHLIVEKLINKVRKIIYRFGGVI